MSECPEGKFGTGCVHPCTCAGAPCDKVTGECRCSAGKFGPQCENCECGNINLTGISVNILSDLRGFVSYDSQLPSRYILAQYL